MSTTLYSWPGNPRGNACRIAAEMAGVEYEFKWTNFQDIKTPEFLFKHPLGKVPFLETPRGSLFETNTILRYFARITTKR